MIRVFSAVAGLFLILALTLAAFRLPVGPSLALMAHGAFGDSFAISRTLVKSIPLALAGLGVIVAWKAGAYNIGGEGQFVMGGLVAAWIVSPLLRGSAPGWVGITLILVGACAGGALWGGLAGWLRAKRGVEVVISTILLNFVAIQLLGWAVSGPLKDPSWGLPLSTVLPDRFMLPKFDPRNDLHAGVLIAVLAAIGVYVFLYRTVSGLRLRLVGAGERVARANRIGVDRTRISAMAISGALCGLAGGVEYAGIAGQLGTSFAQGWGFLAIPVALVAGLHPGWILLSALYFGALFSGSRNLAGFTEQGTTLVYVIQAAAVLALVGMSAVFSRRAMVQEAA